MKYSHMKKVACKEEVNAMQVGVQAEDKSKCSIYKYKTRLVVKCYLRRGADYNQIYSPVANGGAIRSLWNKKGELEWF